MSDEKTTKEIIKSLRCFGEIKYQDIQAAVDKLLFLQKQSDELEAELSCLAVHFVNTIRDLSRAESKLRNLEGSSSDA